MIPELRLEKNLTNKVKGRFDLVPFGLLNKDLQLTIWNSTEFSYYTLDKSEVEVIFKFLGEWLSDNNL